jgi:hypothetical protein
VTAVGGPLSRIEINLGPSTVCSLLPPWTTLKGGHLSAMKCVNLEKIYTTINITNLPPTFGKPSIKSIKVSLQTWEGSGNGCSRRPGCRCSDLFHWQTEQQ